MYSEDYSRLDQETYEHHPRWEVVCDDGKNYYHNYLIESSWTKFKKYCKNNNLKIKKMSIAFRSNTIHLPEDKPGYFFRRMERAQIFGETFDFFIIGYIQDDKINIIKYKVPEMILDEYETRELNSDNLESII